MVTWLPVGKSVVDSTRSLCLVNTAEAINLAGGVENAATGDIAKTDIMLN